MQQQQQQQHTNQQRQHHDQQQLPQRRNKRLEKLHKLKLREIQSLALEGGDTGRGYCSCDEQWNGSTSSASSPASVSPTLFQNQAQQQQQLTAQEESQCQLKLQNSFDTFTSKLSATTTTTTTTTILPTPSPRTILMKTTSLAALETTATMPNNSIEANEKTSESGSGTNDVADGNGYNRTNRQCYGSVTTLTTGLLKQHLQQNSEHDKIRKIMMEKFNEANKSNESITYSPGRNSIKTVTLRRNPIQQRLKQQHHVRFSDEKNFSD